MLALALLVLGAQRWWHHTNQKRLNEALAELDQAEPGWRLEDLEAAREQVPEEENSARVVVASYKLLPDGWPPREIGDLLDRRNPPEMLPPEDFNRLTKELADVGPALTEARKLRAMPRGRHHISYPRNISRILLKDQTHTGEVVKLLAFDALHRNLVRDPNGALNSCRAVLNAGRSLGDEPLLISQVIRGGRVTDACRAIERTLALGEPSLEELKTLQTLLSEEDAFPDLMIAARGERAEQHALLDALESGDVSVSEWTREPPSWKQRLLGWTVREDFCMEHPIMLKVVNRWIALAQTPPEEQAAAKRTFDQEIRTLPRSDTWTGPLLSLFQLESSSKRKHVHLRSTIVALAAERYRHEKETWPDTIDKLCPKYMDTVPLDPFDGKPLRYRRVQDGVVIYSVDDDGVDNHGNIGPDPNDSEFDVDIGFRLWDVTKRCQPPRPKPPEINPGR
ncbi:MAG TPA: hypothetical protein VH643_14005 [Gemmataceae bacterium]